LLGVSAGAAYIRTDKLYDSYNDNKAGSLLLCLRLYRKQVLESKIEAEKDGVTVPTTLQQYCHSSKPTMPSFESQSSADFDYYDSYSVDADDSDSDIVTVTS